MKPITLTIDIDGEKHTIEDIPAEAWGRFKEAAKKQFPKSGDDAWAAFLSEVIVAGSGGDGETVTYFMTDVPVNSAIAMQKALEQIGVDSWDRFHAYLLRAVSIPDMLRIINFIVPEGGSQQFGTFIATGLDPQTFSKLEEAVKGESFERIMATFLAAARDGTLEFKQDIKLLDSVDAR